MKNKTLKIIFYILIVLLIIMLPNISKASGDSSSGAIEGADAFLNAQVGSPINQRDVQNASDIIYNILLGVGIVAAMVMSVVLGIKFMIGSTSEKAQIKQVVPPFVAGCIIVFGAFAIWKLVVTLTQEL